MSTRVEVILNVEQDNEEVLNFHIKNVHPNDLMAVLNRHASYILQHLRENEQDQQRLRSS